MNGILDPWPWYIVGPLIGLTVPVLLILGNKSFGVSSAFRHICAACFSFKIPFFQYQWKKEVWNMFFVAGIFFGGYIGTSLLTSVRPIEVNSALRKELAAYDITHVDALMPEQLYNWNQLFTLRGVLLFIVGGFMVGFGTRYGGGCTSGHAIMGISNLQWPSVVATCCFLLGGILMANFILPVIMNL